MKLVVGLGNPGKIYKNTRHNIGFILIDKIAQKLEVNFKFNKSLQAEIAECNIKENGGKVKFAKPQTFMNDSGKTIKKIKDYFKIKTQDIWVIHDDVDLELGKVRISYNSTSAGHKGVQSMIENISQDFYRIRIGIGSSKKIPTETWVLQRFNNEEIAILKPVTSKLADLVIDWLNKGIKEQTIVI